MMKRNRFVGSLLVLWFVVAVPLGPSLGGGLPPEPPSAKSKYLVTAGSGFALALTEDPFEVRANYVLFLTPRKKLKDRAYLEVRFQNPVDARNPLVTQAEITPQDERLVVESPSINSLQCAIYEATVYVYRDERRKELMGTHVQRIRSIVNLERVQTLEDYIASSMGGMCD